MPQLKPLRSLRLLKLNQKPCTLPFPPAELFPSSQLVEEENAPRYNPRHFYPVSLHEILNDRYQVKHVDMGGNKRTIYLSRNAFGSAQEIGIPVITDFGLAVRGDEQKYRYYPIQPDIYSAPEVVLKAGWSYSADIWNLGVLMWDLLQGSTPLQAIQPDGVSFSYEQHLANIIALMGPPPRDLIERGRESLRFFDDRKFKYSELVPKDTKLEQLLDRIEWEECIS